MVKRRNMQLSICAVVLTKNEEKNIIDCIESLSFCDEIIVVDDNSEDRTIEVIESLKNDRIKVYKHALNDDFSKQRNYGLLMAKGDWVLYIDADERISKNLGSEILNLISSQNLLEQKMRGFYVRRVDIMWGRELKYGETDNIKLLRLGKKGSGKWEGRVHEEWKIKGSVGELKNPILHYPHQTITDFLSEINFYTDLRAKELYERNIKVHWPSIISYPVGKFFFNYFLKKGFLDGTAGLIVIILMSFHSFLVRGKLWLLWKKDNREGICLRLPQ